MARPAKTLQERVRDRSFLARRHGGLLAGPFVDAPGLRAIQVAWQAAASDRERRLLALDFEQKVCAARSGKRVGGPRIRGGSCARRLLPTLPDTCEGPGGRQALQARGLAAALRRGVLAPERRRRADLQARASRRRPRKRQVTAGRRAGAAGARLS